MSLDLLGEGFDLHGGGQDLVFPHHENERAQAVALGRRFATHWVHNGFVEVAGEKMSKSLGNFTTLLDLIETVDQRAYRLLVLQSHYRSPIEINKDTTDRAERSLAAARCVRSAHRAEVPAPGAPDGDIDRAVPRRDGRRPRHAGGDGVGVRQRAQGQRGARRGRRGRGSTARRCRLRDLRRGRARAAGDVADVPADVAALAAERDAARAAKDFGRADAIRDELQADGWVVEDTASGTLVRRP